MQKALSFLLLAFLFSIFTVSAQTPDANGIVYVTENGTGNGSSWGSATNNLQGAINASGTSKVFVAVGNYPSPTNGFVMKNNVEIYGGFNLGAGITTLAHNRIMPTETTEATVLNGDGDRRVIYNDNNGLSSSAVLDGFTIKGGTARTMIGLGDTGGGIFNYYSSPTLRNLVVKSGYAATAGGGIANINSSSVISNTSFLSNSSDKGGAVYNQYANAVFNNVIFKSNSSSAGGSAIYTNGGTATVTNALITGNYQNFAVVSTGSATTTLNNVTIAKNIQAGTILQILNSGYITANNSIIFGGVQANNGGYTSQNTYRKDLVSVEDDPMLAEIFVNASTGDFRLKPHPDFINKGSNALFPLLDANTKDLAGSPRLVGATIDLGAYEYIIVPDANGIVYVTPNGSGNGSSWSNATSYLQGAIDAAGAQQVYVAVGDYSVGTSSFVMKNGVKIYGGFDPENNNTSFANRIKPTETVRGSVLSGMGTRPVIWNDNNGLTNTAVLDGFTIIAGYTTSINSGAGITNKGVSPTFSNLVIKDNYGNATMAAGGMYNYQSSPVVSNTLFINNQSDYYGGAVVNHSTGLPAFTNVTFKGNKAPTGAAVFNYLGATAEFTNVLMTGNTGNDVINTDAQAGLAMTLINATIADNYNASAQLSMVTVELFSKLNVRNSIIMQTTVGAGTVSAQNSLVRNFSNTTNGNIDATNISATDIFSNPSAGDYSLKLSPVINKGNNALFSGLDANTKDLVGNARLVGTTIDLGAYEYPYSILPDANGTIYVRQVALGTKDGSSWDNATNDLHNAIQANGAQKVFVATGTYYVGDNSFVMKNGVEIYGGFDPANNIKTLANRRIMPDASNSLLGSILNGQSTRPVIWNFNNGLNATAVLDGFTITAGSGASGAGIYNAGASPTLRNLVIRNNTASVSGGGMFNYGSSPTITNTVFKTNSASSTSGGTVYGGAVYNANASAPVLTNVILSGNLVSSSGSENGAGIYNDNSSPKIYNSIIWANIKQWSGAAAGADIQNTGSGTVTLKNSIAQTYTTGNAADLNKVGVNPLFTDLNNGIYSLQVASPAIGAGSNALYTGLDASSKDLAGNPRLSSSTIDIGAYEYQLNITPDANGIVYVKATATGSGNGNNWANATGLLQDAINTTGVQKVYIATGNYNVGSNSFVMKNGVEIYGGFNPVGNTTDWDTRTLPNKGTGDGTVLNGENRRCVIYNLFTSGTALNSTAVLDGFTIMNGSGTSGAGIYNYYASPTLRNLVVRNNTATTAGGGIYNNLSSAINLSNAVIKNNTAQYGGGIYNNSSASVLTNVSITGNSATLAATGAGGGGIFNENANLKLTNVLIANNSSSAKAGGFRNLSGNPVLTNVTLANNTATTNYTAIEIAGGTPQINNTVIYGTISGTYTAEYSLVQGNAGGTNGNLNGTTILADAVFKNAPGGDYTLKDGSPAINVGNSVLYAGLDDNTTDLAGKVRLMGTAIDLGAYEYFEISPDANGIIYVKETATGNKTGNSWDNATDDLHNVIHTADVQKVFVAIGNYNVGANSFVMKNNVEIYGGFDPDNGIKTLADVRILPNKSVSEGSVLNGENARPVIWNVENTVSNTAVLDGFTIKNGTTSDKGGGIRNIGASPVYRNLVVKNNTANSDGGGIYVFGGSPVFTDLVIQNNTTSHYGGGIYTGNASSPKITNAVIKGNKSYESGTGLCNEGNSSPVLTNVLFTGNSAGNTGTANAVISRSGYVELRNVTIADNISANGGVRALTALPLSGASIGVYNSIIFGSISDDISIKQSFLQGSDDTSNGNINATGITEADVFTNPAAGDYTLKSNAIAIDAGEEDFYPGLDANTKDLAGNARVYQYSGGGVLDLGAYESSHSAFPYVVLTPDANGIIYVQETATGDKNGSSWENATNKFKKSIRVTGVQQVWVATGTYAVNNTEMKNNVAIYGGFDPDNNIKTLSDTRILPVSGGVGGGLGSVLSAQNAGAVISNNNNGVNNTAILDGFTLTDGKNSTGAGMYNNGTSPTLRNLWIKANTATSDGGGMYNINSASPVMSNVTLSDNRANYAGGIFNRNSSSPVMTNVVIKNNIANNDGGGMYNDVSASPVMTNIKIIENSAQNGAGMYNRTNSSPVLVNALIADNSATGNGGAIRNDANSSPSLTNATVVGNTGSTTLFAPSGTTSFANSIVYGTVISGTYTAQYSLVQGSSATANGNIDAAGITTNNVFTNPSARDYTLKPTSPVLNKGSKALFTGLDTNTKDLAGNARVYNSGVIDLGAYEYQGESTLPVTLVNFTAKADGNHAKLQWQTASETNNKGFEIYRAESGKQKAESSENLTFIKIGEVPATFNTSLSTFHYTYTDKTPANGNNYYKLVQIDNDGKTTDLGVRTVNFGLPTSDIRLYPNPTTDVFTATVATGIFSQLQVVDLNGRVLQKMSISEKENSKTVSLGAYPAGVYIITLNGNEKTESRKVIKK
ncbi:T9SS type A sorting domain-containing protein [Pedobacter sp. UBA4863]|uniref:T9SS type A sorting domain-containing protein n=1 Tax=Pedobacter sp. UBA4863 TaxID=1947060 RepID=UPI0025CBCF6A|nr:T9SS type A sorting domain-containing protein [Pedobacter sp. UBA4863]